MPLAGGYPAVRAYSGARGKDDGLRRGCRKSARPPRNTRLQEPLRSDECPWVWSVWTGCRSSSFVVEQPRPAPGTLACQSVQTYVVQHAAVQTRRAARCPPCPMMLLSCQSKSRTRMAAQYSVLQRCCTPLVPQPGAGAGAPAAVTRQPLGTRPSLDTTCDVVYYTVQFFSWSRALPHGWMSVAPSAQGSRARPHRSRRLPRGAWG